MALTSRITTPPPVAIHGRPCSIGDLLDELKGEEREALVRMLYELGWNATQVYDTLRDEGYVVGRQSINRHRRQACRCFKDAA